MPQKPKHSASCIITPAFGILIAAQDPRGWHNSPSALSGIPAPCSRTTTHRDGSLTLPFVGREKILLVVLDVAKILQNLTPRVRLCHQLYQLKEGRRTADDAQRRRLKYRPS